MGVSSPAESVNIYDAKSRLSQLVARVEKGDRIVISRYGRPVAQLVPLSGETSDRTPGLWRGAVRIGADFDEFSPDDDADWYLA